VTSKGEKVGLLRNIGIKKETFVFLGGARRVATVDFDNNNTVLSFVFKRLLLGLLFESSSSPSTPFLRAAAAAQSARIICFECALKRTKGP